MTPAFDDLHRFDAVDQTADAGQFVRFLEHVEALPDVQARRRRSYELLRLSRVYQHLDDPDASLGEARRVLRPGGRIVLIDQDWDAFVMDSADPALTREVVRAFSNSIVDGRAGLKHRERLLEAGFSDVMIEAEAVPIDDYEFFAPVLAAIAGAASESLEAESIERWLDDQHGRGRSGRFLALMTHVLASATSP